MDPRPAGLEQSDRRAFLGYLVAAGLGGAALPHTLRAQLEAGAEIDVEVIRCAEELAGISFSDEQRELMVEDLKTYVRRYEAIRNVDLANEVPPAIRFDPTPVEASAPPAASGASRRTAPDVALPTSADDIAFLPVTHLAELIRTRQIGSEELTRLYLERIERLDPTLRAVVTVTEERAIRQARSADAEIARGEYRGALHGIPWGAKDLLAVRGYPTTWGTAPFRDQVIDRDATVVERLDAAGAVLVAKLTLGELAWGDVWFGGTTRNPWNPEQGSSGSSAGPAAATAAAMVGFSIGSETLGSISSPSTRTGVTGLRPSFGRVPRTGAMALAWSMDKLGPMCRSAEDCALVLEAILGPDGHDTPISDLPFVWDAELPSDRLRVGFLESAFAPDAAGARPTQHDLATLDVIRDLGIDLTPVHVPDFPYEALTIILEAEAAAAFDAFTRAGLTEEMARQGPQSWPNIFRTARMIPAVEYINANRIRTLAISAWARIFEEVDVVVTPTGAADQLTATNLTGHPAAILPNGFSADGTPVSITFLGRLNDEAKLLALAHAYQRVTEFHRRRPAIG